MTSQERAMEEVLERLTRLERQNRRLKRTGVAVVVGAASWFLMAQASPWKAVEANEFILKDANGRVRAKLGMSDDVFEPALSLLDDKGTTRVRLWGGMRSDFLKFAGLSLFDGNGRERGMFDADQNGAALAFINTNQVDDALIRGDGMELNGPVTVSDAQGFQATLGVADLVTPRTGETHKTSAASLALFDKNKNVIWKAP